MHVYCHFYVLYVSVVLCIYCLYRKKLFCKRSKVLVISSVHFKFIALTNNGCKNESGKYSCSILSNGIFFGSGSDNSIPSDLKCNLIEIILKKCNLIEIKFWLVSIQSISAAFHTIAWTVVIQLLKSFIHEKPLAACGIANGLF